MSISPLSSPSARVAAVVIPAVLVLASCGTAMETATSSPASSTAAASQTPGTAVLSTARGLPPLTGAAAVGTRDVGRGLRAWYPAVAGTGSASGQYLPASTLAEVGLSAADVAPLRPRARQDATPLPGRPRPVVVLQPGMGSLLELSTSLAEQLASHGYVVLGTATDRARETEIGIPDDATRDARLDAVRRAVDAASTGEIAGVGAVDATRIAVGGHSYGGSIALNAALRDDRITAVFDLDGTVFDDAASKPPRIPILVVQRGGADDPTLSRLLSDSPSSAGVVVDGAGHYGVTDAPVLVPLAPALADQLPIGSATAATVASVDAVVLRFLDSTLVRRDGVPDASRLTAGLAGVAPA